MLKKFLVMAAMASTLAPIPGQAIPQPGSLVAADAAAIIVSDHLDLAAGGCVAEQNMFLTGTDLVWLDFQAVIGWTCGQDALDAMQGYDFHGHIDYMINGSPIGGPNFDCPEFVCEAYGALPIGVGNEITFTGHLVAETDSDGYAVGPPVKCNDWNPDNTTGCTLRTWFGLGA